VKTVAPDFVEEPIFTMTGRSWIRAMTFIRPSHRGHWSTSHPHARCSSVAHAMRDDTFFLGHAVGAASHPASYAAAPSLPETRVVSAAGVVVARSSPRRRF
jgi:hypothetical protein